MSEISDGPRNQSQKPSGVHSRTSKVSTSRAKQQVNIADGPGGLGRDPTVPKTRKPTVGVKKVGKDPASNLTWEQRALRLLSNLEATKGYKDLPLRLRGEVRALIDNAPDGAYS
jgi:hypothetical protein